MMDDAASGRATGITRFQTGQRMSQATSHNGTLYVAGQIALAASHAPVAEQTRLVLDQIDNILAAAGSSRERILSATIWLRDMADFGEMNAVWDVWIPPSAAPARATVGAALALPGLKVEIAVIAAL